MRKWIPHRQLKELEYWLQDRSLVSDAHKYIEKNVRKPGLAYPLAGQLDLLSGYLGGLGVSSIMRGDEDGWQNMHVSWRMLSWVVRIETALSDADHPLVMPRLTSAILSLIGAIALREDVYANWCFERLQQSLDDGMYEKKLNQCTQWGFNSFFPFIMEVVARWKGVTFDLTRPELASLGVYQRVLDDWNSPDDLRDGLLAMCEEHVRDALSDLDCNVFLWRPYDFFPAEMITVRRVRAELGLETPEIEHPLLAAPLMTLPEHIEPLPNPILDKVIAYAKKELLPLASMPE